MAKTAHKSAHKAKAATLGDLGPALDEVLAHAFARSEMNNDELEMAIEKAKAKALPRTSTAMIKALKRAAPQMLERHAHEDAGFCRRNYRRWKKAFDLLEMMWVIAQEAGANFNETYRPEAVTNKDYQFEALTYLHARSLLVTREIICLLHGGFPDGALGRWRTLHELAATALFIQMNGNEIAHRYLASRFFDSLSAAKQLENHAERANLEPCSKHELEEMEQYCQGFIERFGKEMKKQYGWASPALNNNPDPKFSMIEKSVGLDHWRPRYKWATQNTHAPHRPTHALLGMVEAEQQALLVGQSNSGLTDPIHMTAISLSIATCSLLGLKPDFDHTVIMDIMRRLSNEIGPLALKLEQRTFQAHQKRARR